MDKKLALFWERVNKPELTRSNPKDYDKKVLVKSRIVDPLFLKTKGQIIRLSAVDKDWEGIIKIQLKPKQYFLKYSGV